MRDALFCWRTLRPLIDEKQKSTFDEYVMKFFSYYARHQEYLEVLLEFKNPPARAIYEYAYKLLKYRKLDELENLFSIWHEKLRSTMTPRDYATAVVTVRDWLKSEKFFDLAAKIEAFGKESFDHYEGFHMIEKEKSLSLKTQIFTALMRSESKDIQFERV